MCDTFSMRRSPLVHFGSENLINVKNNNNIDHDWYPEKVKFSHYFLKSTLEIGINHKKKHSSRPIEVIYERTEVRVSQGITRLVFVFLL